MEHTLNEMQKMQYEGLINSAQDLETTIGSQFYRLSKFIDLRKDIDRSIRKWWEDTIKELNIDPKKNYVIKDGVISTADEIKDTK